MKKVKEVVTKEITDVKEVFDGAKETVLSLALVVTSAYNWYDLTIRAVDPVEFYVRALSSGLIFYLGARGVVQIFKNIGKKG